LCFLTDGFLARDLDLDFAFPLARFVAMFHPLEVIRCLRAARCRYLAACTKVERIIEIFEGKQVSERYVATSARRRIAAECFDA